MAIRWIPDIGAPVVVTAVDLTLESVAPQYAKWADGIMALGGYLGGHFIRGNSSDFVKNIGIAALPAFAKNVYEYVKGKTGVSRHAPVSFQRVRPAAPVTRTYEPEFNKAGVL